jgi:hypothetical protein
MEKMLPYLGGRGRPSEGILSLRMRVYQTFSKPEIRISLKNKDYPIFIFQTYFLVHVKKSSNFAAGKEAQFG